MIIGKDYSNARVGDFHTLNKPGEDMYDRGKIPRMPWHDVGMQVVGQPARDLARHFIERWNYLLRIKVNTPPSGLRHWLSICRTAESLPPDALSFASARVQTGGVELDGTYGDL